MALWNQPVHQFNSTTIKEALNLYLVPVAVEQRCVLALKCMLNDASLPRCETQIAGYRRLLEMALMEIDKVKHDYFFTDHLFKNNETKIFSRNYVPLKLPDNIFKLNCNIHLPLPNLNV